MSAKDSELPPPLSPKKTRKTIVKIRGGKRKEFLVLIFPAEETVERVISTIAGIYSGAEIHNIQNKEI